MSTSTSIHGGTEIEASAGPTSGAPLTIHCRGTDHRIVADLIIFTNDHALTMRLAAAINDAVADHKAEKARVSEAA